MDRRLLAFDGTIAHTSLKDQIAAERYVDGETVHISRPVVDVLDTPSGTRQCQLVMGEAFRVLDERQDRAWGFAERDGYVGWIPKSSFAKDFSPTHTVSSPRAVALDRPDVTDGGAETVLSFASHVTQTDDTAPAGWTGVTLSGRNDALKFMRDTQLSPYGSVTADAVQIAEMFLFTPYIWGGNSGFGLDCSGLVQVAQMAAGIACPRDSDMQFDAFPRIDIEDLQRGDLVFWKGHVGVMSAPDTLLHANAYNMRVAQEPLAAAIQRIGAKEFGDVIGCARPDD